MCRDLKNFPVVIFKIIKKIVEIKKFSDRYFKKSLNNGFKHEIRNFWEPERLKIYQ